MNRFTSLLFLVILLISNISQGQSVLSDAELKEKQHQFDFWLGHWEVYKYGTDTIVGISHIESILDSVALLEHYQSAPSPYHGKSINIFNKESLQWEQFWIDNGGSALKLAGEFKNGMMSLENTKKLDGKTHINRIRWTPVNGEVRQTWELSRDNGKSWNILFDGLYKRKQ